jgi:very-short-patch-repair endonuclease
MRDPRRARARSLRRAETEAEALLWRRLRGRGLNGFKFVRQEPVSIYFADFVCRDERLIVEVDGATHSTDAQLRSDAARADALARLGYRVLRVANDEVFRNLEGVLETILAALEKRTCV